MVNETSSTTETNPNTTVTDTGITIWHDTDKAVIGDKLDEPVTKQEIMDWIQKYADSEIFLIRNISSLRTEQEAQRIRKYQEYIREHLA